MSHFSLNCQLSLAWRISRRRHWSIIIFPGQSLLLCVFGSYKNARVGPWLDWRWMRAVHNVIYGMERDFCAGWVSVREMIDYMHSLAQHSHVGIDSMRTSRQPPDLSLRNVPNPDQTAPYGLFDSTLLQSHHRGVSTRLLTPCHHRVREKVWMDGGVHEHPLATRQLHEKIEETATDWKKAKLLLQWWSGPSK